MEATRAKLLDVFQKTASEVVGREFDHVAESTAITELGIDSLGMFEIISKLEEQLDVQFPNDVLGDLHTVRDLLDVVEQQQKAAAS